MSRGELARELGECVAIVLAAGRGTRMGKPKALMNVAGRPWWRAQMERLVAAGVPSVWVVSEVVEREMIGSGWRGPLVRAEETAPMLASVIAGLRFIATAHAALPSGVFVLPVDVPAPRPEVWRALIRAGGAVAAPEHGGKIGHPVYLSWDWVGSVLLPAGGASGNARLDELMRGVVRGVPVTDPDVRVNLNTPEALGAWLAVPGRSERRER